MANWGFSNNGQQVVVLSIHGFFVSPDTMGCSSEPIVWIRLTGGLSPVASLSLLCTSILTAIVIKLYAFTVAVCMLLTAGYLIN